MTKNVVLRSKHNRAIAALLQSRNVQDAATIVGISRQTLFRWLAIPEFRYALTQAKTASIDEASRRLLSGQEKALDTLVELMDNAIGDSDHRQAAEAWLEFALRLSELRNVEQRLAELQAVVYGR